MWVYEEDLDGRKLTELINDTHEVGMKPGRKAGRSGLRGALPGLLPYRCVGVCTS